MDRLARIIVTHNKRVVAITVILSLLAAAMLFRMSFNADVTSFIIEGNATGLEYAGAVLARVRDPIRELIDDRTHPSRNAPTVIRIRFCGSSTNIG